MVDIVARCPACLSSRFARKKSLGDLRVLRCMDCGLAYAHPLIAGSRAEVGLAGSSKSSDEFYQQLLTMNPEHQAAAARKSPRMLSAWETIMGRRPRSILDVGCGTGSYAEAFAGLGLAWTGFEVNKEMLGFCRAKGLPVEEMDVMRAPADRKFDVIFLSQVLEHVICPKEFVRKVAALLAPDGLLHIDVPNNESTGAIRRRCNPWHHGYGYVEPYHHLVAYGRKSLSMLLSAAGLEVCHLEAYASDDPTFGQLYARSDPAFRWFYRISRVLKRGYLLVAIARNRAVCC